MIVPLLGGLEAQVDEADASVTMHRWRVLMLGSEEFPRPYAVRQVQRRTIYLHRQLLCPAPGLVVDHINGDTLDNRRANLRVVTSSRNSLNRRGSPGVCYCRTKQKWEAYIMVEGRRHRLGYHATEALARAARENAEKELGL